jgi:hypothetical protein
MNYGATVRGFGDASRLAVNAANVESNCAGHVDEAVTSSTFKEFDPRHKYTLAMKLQAAFEAAGGEEHGDALVLHWMKLQCNKDLFTALRNNPDLSVDGSWRNACLERLLKTFLESDDQKFRSILLAATIPDEPGMLTPMAREFGVGFRRLKAIVENRLLPGYNYMDPTPQQPRSHQISRIVIINFVNMATSRRTPNRFKDFYAKHKEADGTVLVRAKHFYKWFQPLLSNPALMHFCYIVAPVTFAHTNLW